MRWQAIGKEHNVNGKQQANDEVNKNAAQSTNTGFNQRQRVHLPVPPATLPGTLSKNVNPVTFQ